MRPMPLLLLSLMLPAAAWADGIAGQVVDEAGRPLAGIEVTLWFNGSPDKEPKAVAHTGPGGRFAFTEEPRGCIACASAPGRGFIVAWATGVAPVTLRLKAPRSIAGTLTGPGDVPASGVLVCLAKVEEEAGTENKVQGIRFPIDLPNVLRDGYSAHTDAQGRYEIGGLPAGRLHLKVKDPRFVTEMLLVEGDTANARLKPGCSIRGRLAVGEKGLGGQPVAAVPADCDSAWRWETTKTAEDGSYRITGLPPGVYTVGAGLDAALEKTVVAVQATISEAQPEARADLAAIDGGVVAGRVVDAETKAPIPGARVRVYLGEQGYESGAGEQSTPTEGSYRFRVPPGPVRAIVTTPAPRGYLVDLQQEWPVTVKDGQKTTVEIPLKRGLTLAGHVVDAAGKPVAGARVSAAWGTGNGWADDKSGQDGGFRLEGLPETEFSLSATHSDDALTMPLKLKAPFPPDLKVVIGPLPQMTLVGRVVDDRGRPAAEVPVLLTSVRANAPYAFPMEAGQAKTDAEGRYRFTVKDLTARYTVEVASESYRRRGGGELGSDAGPERRFSDLVVVAFSAEIGGRVLDARGRPAAGATVFWASGGAAQRAVTGADGRFRIGGLPNRPILLVARDDARGAAFALVTPGPQEVTLALKE